MRKCISSFATADGKVIAAGEFVEDGDPVIKGREAFFAGVSDPVKAPELGADKEGDTVPEKNQPEPTRTPNVNGVNPVDPPPVDDDDPRLQKNQDDDRDDNDNNDDDERTSRPPSQPVVVEEATADPGSARRSTRKG